MRKADLMEIKSKGNALTKKVVNVILDQGDTDDMVTYMKDVLNHGCQSGIVGELIYYNDTLAFYKKYRPEIHSLLKNTLSDFGYRSPAELFGNKWDEEDFSIEETQNRNLLAWFAFEETVRNIADEVGLNY